MARPDRTAGTAPSRAGAAQVAFRLGLSAESRAAAYLLAKGYRIVARRWRSPVGEIDIVARRGRRAGVRRGEGARAARRCGGSRDARQQRRIIAAAEAWLARHPDDVDRDIRFDVVLVAPWRLPRHIRRVRRSVRRQLR